MPHPAHRPGASPNPADDPTFRRALLRHVDHLAATITDSRHAAEVRGAHAARQRRERVAAAWVYLSCLAVWAQDHGLVPALLRRSRGAVVRDRVSSTVWLGGAFGQLAVHPATQWLMHPDYNPLLWAGTPSAAACADLITTGQVSAHAVPGRPPVTGGTIYPPGPAIGRIVAHVDGVELDPLTAAVGRLRLTVYVGHLMAQAGLIRGPLRLVTIPAEVTARIGVGDAFLLQTGISRAEYGRLHPHLVDLPGAAFPLADFSWPANPGPADPTASGAATHEREAPGH